MGGGGHDVGMAERGRMLARRDEAGEMRHVDHEGGAHFIGDGPEFGEIDVARIGRSAGDDQGGLMLLGERLDLFEVDQVVVAADAILHRVEPFSRHGGARAVGEVATGVEAHAEDRVAGLGQRQHHRAIGLRARVRLDVGEAAVEQTLGALDRQRLDRVRRFAALVVSAAGVAFGIFVGQHRPLRLEHCAADDILRRNQLDLGLLAGQFGGDPLGDRRVGLGQSAGEEAVGLDVAERGVGEGGHS